MATFFGEILPVVSRAVEDEEEELSVTESIFEWKPISTDPGKVSAEFFVLSVGHVATGFLESYCLVNNAIPKLGCISEVLVNNESSTNEENERATLYGKANEDRRVVYCTCNSYIVPDKIWQCNEELFSLLSNVKEVIILDSSSAHEYLHHSTSSDSHTPFVKAICTKLYNPKNLFFSQLEQPNMVKGLAAAVLTTCELKKMPAAVYLCYTDSLSLSISCINAFTPLLKHEAFHEQQDKGAALTHMKKLLSLRGSEHALYT